MKIKQKSIRIGKKKIYFYSIRKLFIFSERKNLLNEIKLKT